ncbi:hypothetical protein N7463_007869 [Penicillium fimorum]|uniref:Uncharacterized protein n=1 Tax=Penicillium fimorum TaxID=1882269 RepID=A0A9X0C804_9EURO|nr:hypothetical protein N7463_007869 [Penicillium fimorum]
MSDHMVHPPHSGVLPDPTIFTTEQIRCLEEATIFLPKSQSQTSITTKRKCTEISFNPFPLQRKAPKCLNSSDSFQKFPLSFMTITITDLIQVDALRDVEFIQEIQDAITDPEFSEIFNTQSLFYWAKDTIETKYAALLSQQNVLKSHANQHLAHQPSHSQDTSPDHAIIGRNGVANPGALLAAPGGTQLEDAQGLKCVSFIFKSRDSDLLFSPEWKEYVWTCRNMVRPDEKFDRLWKPGQADIVRGPICCVGNRIMASYPGR